MKHLAGALDQGTTSTRFLLFDHDGNLRAKDQREHRQIYPAPGLVEHDPAEIWERSCECIREAMRQASCEAQDIVTIGITNQRETTVVWDPYTGVPLSNAIVWQDTRSAGICERLGAASDLGQRRFAETTGLPLATYFSAPKMLWLLENLEGLRAKAESGRAVFGTIDSWLVWNLNGGAKGHATDGRTFHVTDVSNASRTMLLELSTLQWGRELCADFGVPEAMLPRVESSIDPNAFGRTKARGPFGGAVPIGAVLGDQQAALFGQACFNPGDAKNTYGTGCFLLMNTGEKAIASKNGLITTVAYRKAGEPAVYALEGSIAMAGSLVQWARDRLGIITEAREINDLAASVPDSGGVYMVPAFSGLFAPHWRSDARGLIIGLTHFAGKAHLARSLLEATAFQTREIFEAMKKDSGLELSSLKVDGGMVASEVLMQFQADILGTTVKRPRNMAETTGLGAAYAAGLALGFWKDTREIAANWKAEAQWTPTLGHAEREGRFAAWNKAVERSKGWIEE